MIDQNAYKLGMMIGKVLEVDTLEHNGSFRRNFMRVRVDMDIEELLLKGTWVQRRGEERVCVEFKYERLSSFCFKCGRISHTDKTCHVEGSLVEEGGYGAWL